jgi:mRNA interferase HigB
VRIIKQAFLHEQSHRHPQSRSALSHWLAVVKSARWDRFADVRLQFPSADQVEVASGKLVVVFNICGNKYRLVAAVHYNSQRVYTLAFMTHAHYSKNTWKDTL